MPSAQEGTVLEGARALRQWRSVAPQRPSALRGEDGQHLATVQATNFTARDSRTRLRRRMPEGRLWETTLRGKIRTRGPALGVSSK